MSLVHTLVAEVLTHLIDSLEASYDEALQIELSSDTHVHILIQRIEVGDKRTGRGTTGNVLQDGGVNLRITCTIENATQRADDGGTLQEGLLHALVHHQVDIALAITKLRIVELIVSHTVLIFHDRQGLQGLRQQRQLLAMNTDLARLSTEHKALHANEIADIEQFLEDDIIEVFILVGTQVVASDVYLNTALRVLQLSKGGLSHHSAAHHTAGNGHLARLVFVAEIVTYVCGKCISGIFGCGIGVDTHISQLLQTLPSADFLFT